ncbi:hypothetical protein D9V37_14625 [Nocardioides mangrovicus]|uniref:Acyl-CoA dehydrogenase/oxidase C-terminal domain-containing protein n=1 Tax=Nocardioides mangrovicus TaxID=2478913 RepID=A0A3L8NW91_9ACTN|nr:acyl-CoA dehydrogenase family protein [Nocardioides mangrovicus]RLV47435.1 hypothetical protein D9V37_14625 [Nocardioides mangrovicus]
MSTLATLPTTAPDSEEEAAVRDTAREIAVRCDIDGDHADCWRRLEESGFAELRSADDDGAPLADTTMTAIVVQELASVVCGAPLLGTLLSAELLRLAAVEVEGPMTVLLDEDLGALSTDGTGVAWDAGHPVATAVALDGDRLVAHALGASQPTQDLTRPSARPSGGPQPLNGSLDKQGRQRFDSFARLMLTADLLGTAGGVLADAVRYAGDRVQFGAPIGKFQAVQHIAARAYSEVEAIRSSLLHGAWSLDAGRDHHEASLVAKAYAGRAGVAVVEAAVQMYGGVAITWEFRAHRHLRRALLDALVLGTPDAAGAELLVAIEAEEA